MTDVPMNSNFSCTANLLNISTFLCTDRLSFYFFNLCTPKEQLCPSTFVINATARLERNADGHLIVPLLNVGHDVFVHLLLLLPLLLLFGQAGWQLVGLGVVAATVDLGRQTFGTRNHLPTKSNRGCVVLA